MQETRTNFPAYHLSPDVIEKFKEAFDEKDWDNLFYRKNNGKYQLDLWKANESVFRESGICKEHIAVTNVCIVPFANNPFSFIFFRDNTHICRMCLA